jgi:hypothetical protein
VNPPEGQVADDPTGHTAQHGHPEQCHQGQQCSGGLGVRPRHRDRGQLSPQIEADEQSTERQDLHDGAEPEPLDRGQRHHDEHHHVDQVHRRVGTRVRRSEVTGSTRTNAIDVR